ncbi:MAG: hypothetical protein ACOX3J_03265 [Clostridia bacterium]|jgi:hypothetical protein
MKGLKIAFYAALMILVVFTAGCSINTDINDVEPTNMPVPTNRPRHDAPYYRNLVEGQAVEVPMYPEEHGEMTPFGLNVSDTVCIQFYAVTDFNKISLVCPSYNNSIGTLKMSLYKWNINVDISLSGEVIHEQLFVNYKDNETLHFEFEPQEEGEYMLEISGIEELTGVWGTTAVRPNIRVYYNGQQQDASPFGSIGYLNTPDVHFGPLSQNIPYYFDYVKAPAEIQFGDNHPVKMLDVRPDSFYAIDRLNRKLPSYKDYPEKHDKTRNVGILYYLKPEKVGSVLTVKRILERFPDAISSSHGIWLPVRNLYWETPLYGNYNGINTNVYRKHAELLANAGVDFVVVNLADGLDMKILHIFMQSWEKAISEGVNAPKVVFATDYNDPGRGVIQLKQLFKEIYKAEKYRELWFYYEGKPLILSNYDVLNTEFRNEQEIKQYFTMRRISTSYFDDRTEEGVWGIQSVYPQTRHSMSRMGDVDQMVVSPAQNANYLGLTAMNGKEVFGRGYAKGEYSYTYTYMGHEMVVDKNRQDAYLYGLNFQQQWDYALYVDPDFVLVNGWNEFFVKRYNNWMGIDNAFVNQFNDEFSTDIEPVNGDLMDNYYYQLVANIRRYKGVGSIDYEAARKSINIFDDISQWEDVPTYNHYINTASGVRNNILKTKVAYDRNTIYFYVETRENLSPHTDQSWMRLYIDTGETNKHWEGFEFVVNRLSPNEDVCYLEVSAGGFNWEIVGEVKYRVEGKVLQIEIPRHMLGMKSGWFSGMPSFNFKWADNVENDGDIFEFYKTGDVAPIGRFTFRFNTD